VVRGWVAVYTLGLPKTMRARRRDEIAADLADERADAIRRGRQRELFSRRLRLLIAGIPDDLVWRFFDAPAMAGPFRTPTAWIPLSRWSFLLLVVVAIGAAGALAIVSVPMITGRAETVAWPGIGPAGFALGCLAILGGIPLSVPWPRRGAVVAAVGSIVGFLAAPWLWGCWFLALVAVGVRWYQAIGQGGPRPVELIVRGPRR
jgi:hypothetical protein